MEFLYWTENSGVLSCIFSFLHLCKKIKASIVNSYLNSFTYNFLYISKEWINRAFKHSLFRRITEVEKAGSRDICGQSIIVRNFAKLIDNSRNRFLFYFGESKLARIMFALSKDIEIHPLKRGGWVGIIAILVDSALIALTGKDVNMFGMSLRGTLLLIAIVCIFCDANWHNVKQGSFAIKKISKI